MAKETLQDQAHPITQKRKIDRQLLPNTFSKHLFPTSQHTVDNQLIINFFGALIYNIIILQFKPTLFCYLFNYFFFLFPYNLFLSFPYLKLSFAAAIKISVQNNTAISSSPLRCRNYNSPCERRSVDRNHSGKQSHSSKVHYSYSSRKSNCLGKYRLPKKKYKLALPQ